FSRYLPMVQARGARTILWCRPERVPLLEKLKCGVDEIVTSTSPLPRFGFHCPLVSLPIVFRTSVATVPNEVPYFSVDANRTTFWRNQLAQMNDFKVGLCWRGSSRNPYNQQRHFDLSSLQPLAGVPNVSFLSLQVGDESEQLTSCGFEVINFAERLDA